MSFDPTKYTTGKWMKGDDIEDGERIIVTIEQAYEHTFEQNGDVRPALDFLEIEQSLSLNKTNTKKLIDLFGNDPDDWQGKQISLIRNPQSFNGKFGVLVGAPPKKRGPTLLDDAADVVFEQPATKRKPVADEEPF